VVTDLGRFDDFRLVSDSAFTTTTYAYNAANEQTKMTSGKTGSAGSDTTFTYDAWGRTVTKTQGDHLAAYRYRFGDKMSRIDSNFPDEAAYVVIMYDGLGKRRYKSVSGTPNSTTYWWRWGAGWNVVNEYTDVESTWDWDPENLTATYVPDPAGMGLMAEITGADPSSGAYRYYFEDNLGSVRRVRAHDKSSLAEYEYTPYGDAYSQSGLALNRGFTGHKWDSEIAMYWAPYRHYLPAQARWLTRDPLGILDGPNVYGYARQNPVVYFDPTGEQVPVWLLTFIAHLVAAGVIGYWCGQCMSDAAETMAMAKNNLPPDQYLSWACTAKPGAECLNLCGTAAGLIISAIWRAIFHMSSPQKCCKN